VRNRCEEGREEGREIKCFNINAIAGGKGPLLYVLNRFLEFFRIHPPLE
jgi:hypothetical protein